MRKKYLAELSEVLSFGQDSVDFFLDVDLDLEDLEDLAGFFFGTLAPFLRASESPMAIACFLLVTFLPDLPLFKVPFFRLCIAFSTFSDALLPYFAIMHLSLADLSYFSN